MTTEGPRSGPRKWLSVPYAQTMTAEGPRSGPRKCARFFFYLLCFAIPFSIAAIEITFPILLIAWLIGWRPYSSSSTSIWRQEAGRPILLALAGYLLLCALSIPISTNPKLSIAGFIGKTLEYALFFLILADVAKHPDAARKSITLLVTAGLLVCIYGLLQEWLIHHQIGTPHVVLDPIRGKKLIYDRMVGPYSNPIDMATFLMVTSLLLLPRLFSHPLRKQLGGWALWLLFLGCIAWTESKGGILGLSFGLLFILLLNFRNRRMWTGLGMFALAMTAVLVLYKQKNFSRVIALADPGSRERVVMWNAALSMIKDKPVFGLGLNTFMSNYMAYVSGPNQGPAYAHNCFLQIAAETGLISLFFFLLFLACIFWTYLRALRYTSLKQVESRPDLVGMSAALFGFLVQSGFDTNLYSLRQVTLFWALAGAAVGFSCHLLQQDK